MIPEGSIEPSVPLVGLRNGLALHGHDSGCLGRRFWRERVHGCVVSVGAIALGAEGSARQALLLAADESQTVRCSGSLPPPNLIGDSRRAFWAGMRPRLNSISNVR
jgi:hypothetical protein